MFIVDKAFLLKLILVNKSSEQHPVKNPTAHAHLNRSVGPYTMYIEDMLWYFDRSIRFCAVYYKRETEYHLCKKNQILCACAA